MSEIRNRTLSQQATAAVLLMVALLATWFAYSQGITGSTQLDDRPNLNGLADVGAEGGAKRFIFSGRAGPLGRPLSLATFVPEAHAWPNEPAVFIRTNVLIHLCNGVLVAWLLYLLGVARQQTSGQAALIGVGSGALWMMLPILASSSFLIIQRMTTLSASFVLLGGIGYLVARQRIAHRPKSALCLMTMALGMGAALGVLAKESGALLFLYVLAMEATLLSRPTGIRSTWWHSWFFAVLVLPAILLLAYLVTRLPYPESVILVRDFNGFERLLTQAGILWKYLYLAFVPNLPGLGPFHDDYVVQRSLSDPTALLAVAAWLATIFAAIMLRHRTPLFTFAITWYLLGHILESSTIALELYFEHRNYLPLIGPVYALVASTAAVEPKWRRILVTCMSIYLLVLGGVLYSVASLWGTPAIAAEMWYIYRPGSIRAAERIAEQMEREGDLRTSRKIFREVRKNRPDAHYLEMQILLYSCFLEPDVDHSLTVRDLQDKLRTMTFSHSATGLLQNIRNAVREQKCRGVNRTHVYNLGESILANPRYSYPDTTQVIHAVLARIALEEQDKDLAMKHIEDALSVDPAPETLIAIVGMLNATDMQDAANKVLDQASYRAPSHVIRSKAWRETVNQLKQAQANRAQ